MMSRLSVVLIKSARAAAASVARLKMFCFTSFNYTADTSTLSYQQQQQ